MAQLRVALALLLMPVAGCVSVLPPADAQITKQLGQAVDSVNEIAETASIPYADRSFKALQPHYVRALASLRGAKTVAEQRELYGRGRLFHRPTVISVSTIDNCIGAVNALMEINRTKDLDSRDLDANPVRATCTVPKLIEGDLNRGG